MATLVGTQSDFKKAVKELIELDYDAKEAYQAAIDALKNPAYKEQMEKFKKDHERHIEELNGILSVHGEEKVTTPSAKQWLTKGKVIISQIVGNDKTILKAMYTNEEDTNTAYEKVNQHENKWNSAIEILKKGLADEKRHKEWIENTLKRL